MKESLNLTCIIRRSYDNISMNFFNDIKEQTVDWTEDEDAPNPTLAH